MQAGLGFGPTEGQARSLDRRFTVWSWPSLVQTHPSLRRTFASLMFAIGRTPPEVMDALGRVDARTTLQIYARTMRRDEDKLAQLKRLVGGL
jgi:integrase